MNLRNLLISARIFAKFEFVLPNEKKTTQHGSSLLF